MSADDTPDNDDPAHPYETEDSFHPMGEQWEGQMRAELEDTDYDADLGMEMARDAQRLVAGEITEEEFYAEYHDDVEAEFEGDERPVFDDIDAAEFDDLGDDGSVLEALADIDLESDDASRREVMKKMGAGAAFLGYGAYSSYEQSGQVPEDVSGINAAGEDEREHRWGMVIDLERCDGCLACVAGCVDENGTSTGANWMYVFPYQNEDTDQENFLVRPCQHCSNAPCAKVCPVRARHVRDKDGLVLTDYETCIGCRYCQVACPYGVNYFQWGEPDVPMEEYPHVDELDSGKPATPDNVQALGQEERDRQLTEAKDHVYDTRGRWVDGRPPQGVMGKCTMCPTRQDGHSDRPMGTTACQDACDDQGMSAIHFGDLEADEDADPEIRRPKDYLERRSENGKNRRDIKFDADVSFTLGDSAGVEDGSYTVAFVERRSADENWALLDTDDVILTSGPAFEESSDFAPSSITVPGVPVDGAGVLYTDEDTEIPTTLSFDDDEFDDAKQRDVDVELRLSGAGEDVTVASETVTLSQADDLDSGEKGRIDTDLSLTVTSDDLAGVESDVHALSLVVAEPDGEETVKRVATRRRVFVTDDRPESVFPEADYEQSRLTGELGTVPTVVSTQNEVDIEGTVQYPNRPQTRAMELRLLDEDGEQTADSLEYEFTDANTSNTQWGGKQSSFKLLENLGTQPNVTYLGNEPGPKAEQKEGPVTYESISSDKWDEHMNIVSERKHHLDYGAAANSRTDEGGAD